ncbi:hypothetical protein NQZ68_007985 [Dissostichus eleginoides]|nr:hypothetical protein NQZ68_007985 [Dissostichus eleginoides]
MSPPDNFLLNVQHLRPPQTHIRAPPGHVPVSQPQLRKEQALLYDEQQLLLLACSQVAVGSILSPH